MAWKWFFLVWTNEISSEKISSFLIGSKKHLSDWQAKFLFFVIFSSSKLFQCYVHFIFCNHSWWTCLRIEFFNNLFCNINRVIIECSRLGSVITTSRSTKKTISKRFNFLVQLDVKIFLFITVPFATFFLGLFWFNTQSTRPIKSLHLQPQGNAQTDGAWSSAISDSLSPSKINI